MITEGGGQGHLNCSVLAGAEARKKCKQRTDPLRGVADQKALVGAGEGGGAEGSGSSASVPSVWNAFAFLSFPSLLRKKNNHI